MSLEDSVLCALISPGYEPCPTDPTALSNDLPWSYRGPFHHFENASPLSSTSSSSNSNNIFRSQSASPQDLRPTDEAFWLPDASSFSELDGSSTRAFNDIFREIYATNMPVVYACPYTPVPRQLTMRQSFEPSDVASTISHASRRNPPESSQPSHVELTCSPASENDSCLSSMSPSSSSYSQQSHFLTPPTFQPTDSVLTHGDASKSLATLDLWSTDAYLDGIDPGTDATNNFQDQTVEDFDFLNRIQGETDTIRDHGAASGIIGGRYDGMTFSTIAASIVPDTTRYNSVEGSAFYHDCPVSFARGGGNFGFRSQVNGKYGLNMNLPTRSTYPVGEPQEMINPGALENKHMYLEPSRMILHPGSHQAAEDTQELVSHDLAGDCYPAFQDTLTTPCPNIDTFNSSNPTQMDADSFSSPSSEMAAPTSVLRVPESSNTRPHDVHTTSVLAPLLDMYTTASSSKTISNQPVGIMSAKFNSFGRIGQFTNSDGGSKTAKRKPYQKRPRGPKPSVRQIEPPPSVMHRFADGKHKYERFTDFQIATLLKTYKVDPDQVPTVFYGLRRQHTSNTIYSCPMDGAQLTLTEFEAHCMDHHSTIGCDSACPNHADTTTRNHTSYCQWHITCTLHRPACVESPTEAMKHFEDVHLLPHGLQCAHCDSVHEGARTLSKHMERCVNMENWGRRH